MKRNIVITGGAGFIGSHVVRLFVNKYPEYNIINLDKLTYSGNLANLKDIEDKPNYKFVKMDNCDFDVFYKLNDNCTSPEQVAEKILNPSKAAVNAINSLFQDPRIKGTCYCENVYNAIVNHVGLK